MNKQEIIDIINYELKETKKIIEDLKKRNKIEELD